jgi:hypothetical protein
MRIKQESFATTSGTAPRSLRFLLVLWIFGIVFFCASSQEAQAQESEDDPLPWVIMPRVGVGLEYGGFPVREEDFSSAFRYQLLLDVLEYQRHLLYMEFDGETSLGIPNDRLAFNRLRHQIAILGYRYDLGDYYGGFRFYHRCYNPLKERGRLETDYDRTSASIFYLGLEFIDKAMLVGQKDRGINFENRLFEFLGKWHVAISLNRVVSKEATGQNWLFTGKVRYDILRYYNLVPYLEGGGDLVVLRKLRGIPVVEGGVRFHGTKADFIPFIQWGRTEEWPHQFNGQEYLVSRNYLFCGGRLEFLLDGKPRSSYLTEEKLKLFPEIHGLAEYSLFFGSQYHKGFGNVRLNLDILRWRDLTIFANPGFTMDSQVNNFGPDKLWYQLNYGLRYWFQKYFLEGFVLHERRLDAYEFRGLNENAHRAGGRIGTQGMLLGHYDDRISFNGLKGFAWLNQWNAEAGFSHYFNTEDWPFLWNVAAQARWDVLRWRFLVPYVQSGLEWRSATQANRDTFEYYVEPGVRLKGGMDLLLFYRFQHQEAIRSAKGPSENQSLIGIRAMF